MEDDELSSNGVSGGGRPPGDGSWRAHRLYRRANLLRRSFGRVSRIHLYEAQEHFVYLSALTDFYEKASEQFPSSSQSAQACLRLSRSRLERASVLLSRLQQDLNFLWREMAQVYSMLIVKVIPQESLAVHLDFCAEEAKRLALDKDPEVTQMLQRAAELKDTDQQGSEMRRLLRALVERFTRVRTGRIHEQFVNIASYRKALLLLIPITLLLIKNADLFLNGGQPVKLPALGDMSPGLLGPITYLFDAVRLFLEHNPIAFVFFAGLLGGFFSVTLRLRSRKLIPGEDAYFAWYVLTKPWIGALGAAVFLILLKADLVSLNLGTAANPNLMKSLDINKPGAVMFAFAFLAGFSERLIFPRFGEGTDAPQG